MRSWTDLLIPLALLCLAPHPEAEAAVASGCGGAGLTSGTYTLAYGGVERTYRLYVPRGYDPATPAPLIALFHGWGGDEDDFLSRRIVTAQADRRGYLLVAPRGLGSGPPDRSINAWTFSGSATGLDGDGINPDVPGDTSAICDPSITPDYGYASCEGTQANTCAWTHCQGDDVAFTLALIERLEASLCVDADNLFAAGGSNGGMFTWELGQDPRSAPTFRAIAPLIGLPHRGYLDAQGKAGALPALVITGTRDTTVPPGAWEDMTFTTTSGGDDRFYYTGASAITQRWAEAHGCDTSEPARPFPQATRQADCRTYCPADGGWPEVLDCRADMGHTYSLSWTFRLMLDFFDQHRL